MLIPATLRSREHAHDGRTMDGFHTAMRTLSRRTAPTDSRRILIPPASLTSSAPSAPSRARRRAVFLRVLWGVAITLMAALALDSAFFWFAQVVADVTLAGVVMWLRRISIAETNEARQARRDAQLERTRRDAAQVAAFRARNARPAYDVLDQRRAVND